jgi:hypothetical protein
MSHSTIPFVLAPMTKKWPSHSQKGLRSCRSSARRSRPVVHWLQYPYRSGNDMTDVQTLSSMFITTSSMFITTNSCSWMSWKLVSSGMSRNMSWWNTNPPVEIPSVQWIVQKKCLWWTTNLWHQLLGCIYGSGNLDVDQIGAGMAFQGGQFCAGLSKGPSRVSNLHGDSCWSCVGQVQSKGSCLSLKRNLYRQKQACKV